MSETARDLLRAFDVLSPADQSQVAAEIIRRLTPGQELPDAALDALAAELFRAYDAEEATRATP